MEGLQLVIAVNGAPLGIAAMDALREVDVTCQDRAPATFQLVFVVERFQGSSDYTLVELTSLQPFASVSFSVQSPTQQQVLINGYVTQRQLGRDQHGDTLLTIAGQDVSAKMSLMQTSAQYAKGMTDLQIVIEVLHFWVGRLFVDMSVGCPFPVGSSAKQSQNATDRDFLLQLADRNACRFYVWPLAPGESQAVWGPPPLWAATQPVINADNGPGSHVTQVSSSVEDIGPTVTYGRYLDRKYSASDLVVHKTTRRELTTQPALGTSYDPYFGPAWHPKEQIEDLQVRGTLVQLPNSSQDELHARAHSQVDQSVDGVTKIEVSIESERYGRALVCPGMVAVRGLGNQQDGLYYVKSVKHKMTTQPESRQYQQEATLTRQGVGSTIYSAAT